MIRKIINILSKLKLNLLNVSVFIKIIGISLGAIMIFGLFSAVAIYFVLHNVLVDNLIKRWTISGKNIGEQLGNKIIVGNLVGVNNDIKNLENNFKELRYIILIGKNGQVIDSSFGRKIPDDLYMINIKNINNVAIEKIKTKDGIIFDVSIPINFEYLSNIRFGIKEEIINSEIYTAMFKMFFYIVIITFISIVISFLLANILYKPIKELNDGIEQVSRGNFYIELKPWAEDELGRLTESFNKMTESLRIKEKALIEKEKLRLKLIERIITTQEEERTRLSREIHDTIGQLFSLIKISLHSLQNTCKSKFLQLKFNKIKEIINNAINEIHRLAVELRPPILKRFGLIRASKEYLKEFNKNYGIKTRLITNFNESLRLNEAIEIGLFRIIQEALINVQKHSNADQVILKFFIKKGILNFIIKDNGKGFTRLNTDSKHLGIVGMKERVNIMGGKMRIKSQKNKGVTICIKIKIK